MKNILLILALVTTIVAAGPLDEQISSRSAHPRRESHDTEQQARHPDRGIDEPDRKRHEHRCDQREIGRAHV